MNIKRKFLALTQCTYPHGCEGMLEDFLPNDAKKDDYGNYYVKIGDSKTMFTCHLDTASSKFEKINQVIDRNFIRSDGSTILGADDKAGVVILLNMISKKIPGLYYFFRGEEVGCVGSKSVALGDFGEYDRCISFDRRGYNSIITHQMWGRCCSDEFGNELSKQLSINGLKFKLDNTGVSTDSASFMDKIPECTNISVGYFNEHTNSEYQDISFLTNLAKSVLRVQWESLPIKRDMNEESVEEIIKPRSVVLVNKCNISSDIEVIINDELYIVRLNQERILDERRMIYEWMFMSGCYSGFRGIDWDGKICYIDYDSHRVLLGDRQNMIDLVDDLSKIPVQDLTIIKKLS